MSKSKYQEIHDLLSLTKKQLENIPGCRVIIHVAFQKDKYKPTVEESNNMEYIVNLVADHFNTTKDEIKGKSRKTNIVFARYMSVAAIKHTYFVATYNVIADYIGYLGESKHTSVFHSLKTHNDLYDTDESYRIKYESIIDIINQFINKQNQKK